jgi:hypothetical protein
MTTYYLLRSNKKSGPYDLDQLLKLGLKPYDLVWLEGKSAAWRYPSEVEILKDYSPVAEEQPFDRFYKRPGEEKAPVRPAAKTEASLQTETTILQPVISKKVFVAMPVSSTPKTTIKPMVPVEPPVKNQIIEPANIKVEEPVLKQNYSESFDEIKQRYTETYLNRKKKTMWPGFNSTVLQVFGGAIFFCAIVVLAYKNFTDEDKPATKRTIVIQPEKTKPALVNNTITLPEETPPSKDETINDLPAATVIEKEKTEEKKTDIVFETPAKKSNAILPEKKTSVIVNDKPEIKKENNSAIAEQKTEKPKPRLQLADISGQVSVKANNYKQRAFGGVQNLELTVTNQSAFVLDKVLVELQYLKPSEEPIKTESIVFNSVAPGGTQTIKIPDFLRGIKVKYKITNVSSTQYENSTAGL